MSLLTFPDSLLLQVELDIVDRRTLAECEMVIQEAIDEIGIHQIVEVFMLFDTHGQPPQC